jgi:hypothetical protein
MHVEVAACLTCSSYAHYVPAALPTAAAALAAAAAAASLCSFKPLQGVTSSMMVWLFENLHR